MQQARVLILTATIALLAIAPLAMAGTARIKGKVVHSETGEILGAANIMLKGTTQGASTDEDGYYHILNVPKGTYEVIASRIGFATARQKVTVAAGKETTADFRLHPTVLEIGGVVVTATRTPRILEDIPVHTEVIGPERIEAKNAENLLEALEGETGIKVQTTCSICNAAEIRMQGLSGGHTQVLIDGQPIVSGFATVYGLSQIPAENIERIEIVKGAGSAMYGSDAIAGVVNIITKSALERRGSLTATVGDFGARSFRATLAGKKDGTAGVVTVSRTKSDAMDANRDGISEGVDYERTALSAKVENDFSPQMSFTATGRILEEERLGGYMMRLREETDISEQIRTQRSELGGTAKYHPSVKSELTVRGTVSRHDQHALFEENWYDAREDIVYGELQYNTYLTPNNLATAGVSAKSEEIEESARLGRISADAFGVYLQNELEANPFSFVAGVRYDGHSEFGSRLSPRGAILVKPRHDLSLRGSYGLGFKAPTVFFEEMHYCPGGFRYTIRRNPDISPEKSRSANLDIEHRRGNAVMQLNLFRTDVRDMIQGEVVGKDEEAGRLEYMYVNVGKARTQGVETHIGLQIGLGWSISAGYAYLDAKDVDADERLPFRSRHTADWSVRYENCQWGLDVDFSGELVGSMLTQSVGEDDEGNEILTEGESPDFSVWNARISKQMMKSYKVFFGVDNLFDYVQKDWTVDTEYIWGPLRGRFVYGGFTVQF